MSIIYLTFQGIYYLIKKRLFWKKWLFWTSVVGGFIFLFFLFNFIYIYFINPPTFGTESIYSLNLFPLDLLSSQPAAVI